MTGDADAEPHVVVELREVSCIREGALLRHVSLRFARISFNVLVGDRCSGLLLRLASLLEPPESGEVYLLGQATAAVDEATRSKLRSRHFGFVFSSPCLLPGLSAAENVAMPLFKVLQLDHAEAAERTSDALGFVGLRSLDHEDVDTLSRFDQQRVAFARAIAHRPAVIVLEHADTGLNGAEAAELLELARRAREEFGATLLTTFTSETAARRSDRILAVEDGVVCQDSACAPAAQTQQSSMS